MNVLRLRSLRQNYGLHQHELGETIGVSQDIISNYWHRAGSVHRPSQAGSRWKR
jgi:transcriptional regulator with XRE-family HTH domain